MNQLIRRALVVVPLLVFSWTLGCAGSAKKATVNGTVTFDNKPLKEGVVRFVPIDGQSQTTTARTCNLAAYHESRLRSSKSPSEGLTMTTAHGSRLRPASICFFFQIAESRR
jgi:hypothetical protein